MSNSIVIIIPSRVLGAILFAVAVGFLVYALGVKDVFLILTWGSLICLGGLALWFILACALLGVIVWATRPPQPRILVGEWKF